MQSAWAVLYCHLLLDRFYHIFPHYLIQGTVFGKNILNTKCMFCISLQIWSETFLIRRIVWWDFVICVQKLHIMYLLFLSDFNENWILQTDFGKILKFKFSSKSVQWEPSCSMRMDGRTEGRTWKSWQSLFAILRMILKCEVRRFFIKVQYPFVPPNKLLSLTIHRNTEATTSKK